MTAEAVLDALRARGVEVFVADSQLRYRGPAGALDSDLRRAATEHRGELLALLTKSTLEAEECQRERDKASRPLRLIPQAVRPSPVIFPNKLGCANSTKSVESSEASLPAWDAEVAGYGTTQAEIDDVIATVKELFPINPAELTAEAMMAEWESQERIRSEYEALQGRPWNVDEADAELRQALAAIDAALSAPWLSPSQRNVVGAFKVQVENYHTQQDPQLFGAAGWIEAHVRRWRAEHEVAVRRGEGR